MRPISPVLPSHPQLKEVRYGANQSQYQVLPAIKCDGDEERVISCWRLTPLERLRALLTGKLWLQQLTFGQPLQPQLPSVVEPRVTLDGQ